MNAITESFTKLSNDDVYLFNEGTHTGLYERLGAHIVESHGVLGTYFAVWAPNAEQVSMIGDFNGWYADSHPLLPHAQSGIWEGFIPGIGHGAIYKFHVRSRHRGYRVDKADPFARCAELPPKTGSVVWDSSYDW